MKHANCTAIDKTRRLCAKAGKMQGRNKRNNILNILNNIESSLFGVVYYRYKDVSKKTRQNKIAEGTKLKRQ